MEMVRFIIAAIMITAGVVIEIIAVFGVFKLNYALSRFHAAALGDTGALGLVILGLMVMSGFTLFTLKLLLVWIFLWLASSVSSHVMAYMITVAEEERAREFTEFVVDKVED